MRFDRANFLGCKNKTIAAWVSSRNLTLLVCELSFGANCTFNELGKAALSRRKEEAVSKSTTQSGGEKKAEGEKMNA